MKLTLALLLLASACHGMDWQALASVESGNNDYAVGRANELSRYQLSLGVINEWHFDASSMTNQPYALSCAKQVLAYRLAHYTAPAGIYYEALLWRCPARVNKPTRADKDYANRVKNLAERK